jgi:hypothetical protein
MVLLSDGRSNEAIALLKEVSRELSDSYGIDHPLVTTMVLMMTVRAVLPNV